MLDVQRQRAVLTELEVLVLGGAHAEAVERVRFDRNSARAAHQPLKRLPSAKSQSSTRWYCRSQGWSLSGNSTPRFKATCPPLVRPMRTCGKALNCHRSSAP